MSLAYTLETEDLVKQYEVNVSRKKHHSCSLSINTLKMSNLCLKSVNFIVFLVLRLFLL